MTLIRALGSSLLVCGLLACNGTSDHSDVTFSEVRQADSTLQIEYIAQFCDENFKSNPELYAVASTFAGDYRTALEYTVIAERSNNQEVTIESPPAEEMAKIEQQYLKRLSDTSIPDEQRSDLETFLKIMRYTQPTYADSILRKAQVADARTYIVEQAHQHHFTLINEAHFSSQHRQFTKSLLAPLYKQGYRYLALETFQASNEELHGVKYPLMTTGYYTKDPVFANLVREAIRLGYTLISYDEGGRTNNERDSISAINIYENTLKKDKEGKVLIHAGYSHINEYGDASNRPMGIQLKTLTGQDILTVDQERMNWLPDSTQLHDWYRKTLHYHNITEPAVLLDDEGNSLVDPVHVIGIDIQVHHPPTRFTKGRPDWLAEKGKHDVDLPEELLSNWSGYLMQVHKQGEPHGAVSVDNMVVGRAQKLILARGTYTYLLINCDGVVKGKGTLTVDI
ncbi:hypothetical protein AB9P05_04385 [Roseivirga sp. BDSF3-8]|uniref:hypothetical protein n=1 Tax=Roseivirga sp. BDSF3-8 TaxID=3241598 RepID=UPI0035324499